MCMGCSASTAIISPPTAKVVSPSGLLKEFSSPIAASLVLGDDQRAFFLCNSDALFPDEFVPPLQPNDCIIPGGLYFILPAKFLNSPLTVADMGALALTANAALSTVARERRKEVKIIPVETFCEKMENEGASSQPTKEVAKRPSAKPGLVRKLSYKLRLCTIEEAEEQQQL